MHFREVVALVVREYVSQESLLPVSTITAENMWAWIGALDGSYIDLIQCIYFNLCGKEAHRIEAIKTVGWWLSHPTTIINILFPEATIRPRKKKLGGALDLYPKYKVQVNWVKRHTHEKFSPSKETLDLIFGLLAQHDHPLYPNTNPTVQVSKQKRRLKISPATPTELPELLTGLLELSASPPERPASPPGPPVLPLDQLLFPSSSNPPSPFHSSPVPGPSTRSTKVTKFIASLVFQPEDADTMDNVESDEMESEVHEIDEDHLYMGNEVLILLDMEQSLRKLALTNQPERDLLISRWCRATGKTFERWNVESETVLVLFDVPAFHNSTKRLQIIRARGVGNLNESTPVNVLRKVIAAHTQAEVLLQLRYEYDKLDDGDAFDADLFDSFCVKCDKITRLWGWSKSLSCSILSKMFNNL